MSLDRLQWKVRAAWTGRWVFTALTVLGLAWTVTSCQVEEAWWDGVSEWGGQEIQEAAGGAETAAEVRQTEEAVLGSPWQRFLLLLRAALLAPFPLLLLITLASALVAARCYLYERYGQLSIDQRAEAVGEYTTLLPGQLGLVETLEELVASRRTDTNPLLIALRGGWGSGKTFLLQSLARRLEDAGHFREVVARVELSREPEVAGDGAAAEGDPTAAEAAAGRMPAADDRPEAKPPVVVYVDIWRHSTERDLHLELLESLLSHPQVPPGWACLRYPLTLLPVFVIRYVTGIFERGQIEMAGLRVALVLPSLLWQNALEHMAALLRKDGRTIVWILDEIDRCSSDMAQSAMTLARRALNLPGSVVVLPYVPEQLQYKVFNPLRVIRPDLDSTLNALVWEYALGSTTGSIEQVLFEEDHPSWKERWAPEALGLAAPAVSSFFAREPAAPGRERQAEPAATLSRTFQWTLGRWLARTGRGRRRRLAYLFEEKYLAYKLPIPGLNADEVASMVRLFPSLSRLYQRFRAAAGLGGDPDTLARLEAEMARGIRLYAERTGLPPTATPMIRHLEGELLAELLRLATHGARLRRQAPRNVSPETYLRTCLTAAVVFAYHRAMQHSRKV